MKASLKLPTFIPILYSDLNLTIIDKTLFVINFVCLSVDNFITNRQAT